MADPSRRLNEADAIFLPMGEAVGGAMAPIGVTILAGPLDPSAEAHQRELLSRLIPASRRRIVKDRLSLALPRWVDVPDFEPSDNWVELPAPGDGTLQAVLDWVARWAGHPFPDGRPPWRSARFDGVTVDGVPGRTVLVGQIHHALMDGGGGRRMVEHYLRFEPDAPLAPLPPPLPIERIAGWERWKEGWALEGRKGAATARAGARRLRTAARDPRHGARRTAELVRAARRLQGPVGPVPLSPLLRRQSDQMRFDETVIDLAGLKAGARAAGGTINDGFMTAVSLGLRAWHRDQGVSVPALRTAMVVDRRAPGTTWEGNDALAVVVHVPCDDDDPTSLIKRCREISLEARDDSDALWLMDRVRAAGNRLPFRVTVALCRQSLSGLDVSLSNVVGLSKRRWMGGVEQIRSVPLVVGTLSAVAILMTSRGDEADLGLTTCPVAVPDPAHLLARLQEGFAAVAALAEP